MLQVLGVELRRLIRTQRHLQHTPLLPTQALPHLLRVFQLPELSMHLLLQPAGALAEKGLETVVALALEEKLPQVLLIETPEGGIVEDGKFKTVINLDVGLP